MRTKVPMKPKKAKALSEVGDIQFLQETEVKDQELVPLEDECLSDNPSWIRRWAKETNEKNEFCSSLNQSDNEITPMKSFPGEMFFSPTWKCWVTREKLEMENNFFKPHPNTEVKFDQEVRQN